MSGDWRDCCNDIDDGFFFMDPPYRDSFANYGTAFTDADLTDLIDFGNRRTDDIMICNRDSADDWFDQRRGSLDIIRFPVTYTAGRRKRTETGFEAKPAVEVLLYRTRGRPQLFEF
jgi:DNA adenine methylase